MKAHLDIVVVGAGPAGMAAAVTAAEAGLSVGLVDDNPAPGGQIWRSGAHLPQAAQHLLARLHRSSVARLSGWRVFDSPEPHLLYAEPTHGVAPDKEPGRAELHFGKLILATGARERFLPFPGWTLPNVMGAGALDAMVRGGLPIEGKRVVVAGTGPLLLAVAAHLARRGAKIVSLCEQASFAQLARFAVRVAFEPAKLWQGATYRLAAGSARLHTHCWPIAAHGSERLRAVTLRRGTKQWEVECDYLACGFHLVPNIELPALLGCRLKEGFVEINELLETSERDIYCAGEPTGIGGAELALLEGEIAALAASGQIAEARNRARRRPKKSAFVRSLALACALNPELRELARDETILCRCEDVRCGALRSRTNWREAKLHTRCGMGPCQGRICGSAAEFLFGWNADSVRPPVFPARVSNLASNLASNPASGLASNLASSPVAHKAAPANLVAAGTSFQNPKETR
jgi:D-hydroxyproline dehydrogenase subunit alpha